MITEIEPANVYFLKPIDALDDTYDPTLDYTPEQLEEFPDLITDNALVVGSKYIMNEVAVYMTDDDIMATTGVAGERCVIITFLSRQRCKEIIDMGKRAWDEKAKKALKP